MKKAPIKCRHCGVELSAKELYQLGGLCFVCEADDRRKDNQFHETHGGVSRPSRDD
jgi:hypothetical protein